jgi:hypothetical protein
VYETYWEHAGTAPVRLEATPAYFSGGRALASKVREVCGAPKIVVVLREPVSRLLSYFAFQQARLRIAETMTLDEYLAQADARSADDFHDPDNEVFFGARGGLYADYLPDWSSEFGADLLVLFFDDLMARPAETVARTAKFLGVDPDGLTDAGLRSENRTTGFRSSRFQRVALDVNDRFEPFLRRHHALKRRLRSTYFRLNGRPLPIAVSDAQRAALAARYAEPNARLAAQLTTFGVTDLPTWLRAPSSGGQYSRGE